jgi:PAS domain S-box-containing protein
MTNELRKTGIDIVGDVPWGTHFCHFYETKEDLLDILIPYFKTGLENNEFCMWIVFDPLNEEEARNALRHAMPEADSHLAAGDIEIVPHKHWYLNGGTFDLHRVINGWREKLAQALVRSYDGMRVNGNEAWLTERDWKNFATYEKELNELMADQQMIVLCTYPLAVTKASELFDVVRTHQFAVAKRHGNWEVVETPELIQTKAKLKKLNEELDQRVFERTRELAAIDEELRKEIKDHKRAKEALQESEGELRSLFAAMMDVVLVLDAEGRYVKIAPTSHLDLHLPLEELLGKKIHEVLPEESADKILHQVQLALESRQTVNFEYKLNLGSREAWFDSRVSPFTENTVFLIARDITERKQVEEVLQESEARFRQLVALLPVAVYVCDESGIILQYNRAAVELWGREPGIGGHDGEQFCGSYKIYRPDGTWLPHEECPMAETLSTGKPVRNAEIIIERPDGSRVTAIVNTAPIVNTKGEPGGAINCLLDITERKQAEEALRESEVRLSLAVNQAGMGIWDADLLTGKSVWSESLFHLLGYEPRPGGEATFEMWWSRVHPGDRERLTKARERARRDRNADCSEYRAVRADNSEIVWLSSFARFLYDDNGEAVRHIGIVFDSTERKRMEEELRRSNIELDLTIRALSEKTENLEELNTALRVLLRQREEDKKELGESVLANVRNLILPYVEKLNQSPLSSAQRTWMKILESHINEITSSFGRTLATQYANLTSTEIRIAALIRDGKSTAQIAELLGISERTVCRHRDNIRKKLGLRGGGTNLRTHLLSLK